jgi:RNA polymerase sigma factor (sigma-70 family)
VNDITGTILDDKHLVNKVLSGDTRSFGIIIKNTEKLVSQIVFKLIGNQEDRKDMMQEIYLRAYNKLPGFSFQSKLSTWIAQISYNTCLDYLRKKKLILADTDILLEGVSVKDEDLLRKDLSGVLQSAIGRLTPLYKTLITLYHNEEMTYHEIGQITGLPEGTVKSYLFRARAALKNDLLLSYKKEDL